MYLLVIVQIHFSLFSLRKTFLFSLIFLVKIIAMGDEITFSEKYNSLENVYVINNLFRKEMIMLENENGEQ